MQRVAILVEQGFEDSELIVPRDTLRAAGIDVSIVGPAGGQEYAGKKGARVTADLAASDAQASHFDALVVPGGHASERMRLCHAMVDLVRDIHAMGKPVAAICHGPQLLISAKVLAGRTLTCYPSIAIDVKNAGGRYVDQPIVEDGNLITSRKPDDLPQFTDALLRQLASRAMAS